MTIIILLRYQLCCIKKYLLFKNFSMNIESKQYANVVRYLICPYCKYPAEFSHDSRQVYHGKDYGPIYVCHPCKAFIGCRKGTYIPLGRLANPELRELKKKFISLFDKKWTSPSINLLREQGTDTRNKAYNRLARIMKIPRSHCNVAVFSANQCRKAIELLEYGIFDDPGRS